MQMFLPIYSAETHILLQGGVVCIKEQPCTQYTQTCIPSRGAVSSYYMTFWHLIEQKDGQLGNGVFCLISSLSLALSVSQTLKHRHRL